MGDPSGCGMFPKIPDIVQIDVNEIWPLHRVQPREYLLHQSLKYSRGIHEPEGHHSEVLESTVSDRLSSPSTKVPP